MKKKSSSPGITEAEIEKYLKKLRDYSNSAKIDLAHKLAFRLKKKYPHVLKFAYYEAVMTAEDTSGLSKTETDRRFRLASQKFRRLLQRLKGEPPNLRSAMKNEYYWFSKQPYKQYRLGVEAVKRGERRAYYSQGVGAAMMAKKYGLQGKVGLMQKWAVRSEKAWNKFFKVDPDWFNAYFFAAMAYGYQNRFSEMDGAFKKACLISGKPLGWKAVKEFRNEIIDVVDKIPSGKLPPRN